MPNAQSETELVNGSPHIYSPPESTSAALKRAKPWMPDVAKAIGPLLFVLALLNLQHFVWSFLPPSVRLDYEFAVFILLAAILFLVTYRFVRPKASAVPAPASYAGHLLLALSALRVLNAGAMTVGTEAADVIFRSIDQGIDVVLASVAMAYVALLYRHTERAKVFNLSCVVSLLMLADGVSRLFLVRWAQQENAPDPLTIGLAAAVPIGVHYLLLCLACALLWRLRGALRS